MRSVTQAVRTIVVPYAVFAGLWIFCSDMVVRAVAVDTDAATKYSMLKGWAFVAVTSLLLAFLVRKEARARLQVAAAFKESEMRLRTLGDNIPESYVYVFSLEPTPHFVYASAGVEGVHGVTASDVLSDSERLLGRTSETFIEAMRRSQAENALVDEVMQLGRADGQACWVHFRSKPRRTASGQTVWDGVAVDVRSEKVAEDQVRRLHEEV